MEIRNESPFFLGMIKVGEAHVELLHFFSTPKLHNLFSSFLKLFHVPSVQEKVYGAWV